MPTIKEYRPQEVIKMLLMADQGAGKTCALAALANAGYNLRILDFDNKLTAMRSYLKPEAWDRVNYITCNDSLTTSGGKVISKGAPTATTKAMQALTNWTDGKLGPVSSWGSDCVLAIDSLTFQGHSALRYVKALAGRDGEQTFPGDWGEAQRIQEGLLQLLYSEAIHCHVIIISHIVYMGGVEEGTTGLESQTAPNPYLRSAREMIQPGTPIKAYPTALGRKLPPIVGQYFDSVLSIDIRTSGASDKRYLITQARPYMPLKNPAPRTVPKEILLEVDSDGYAVNGLAKYFELVLKAYEDMKQPESVPQQKET